MLVGKKDITWFKGFALIKIHDGHTAQGDFEKTIDVLDKELKDFAGWPPNISCKLMTHEQFQDFKEVLKYYALHVVGVDLDKCEDIDLNWNR